VRLYAGVIRFFIIVVLIHVAMFLVVGALARKSEGPSIPPNSLRIATESIQVRTVDPVAVGDTSSSGICNQVYEGLVGYDQKTLEIVPCLAETWEISPDGMTYTFHLRKGVLFRDDHCFPGGKGREMTSRDVKFSLTRVCDPVAMSTGFWLFDDRVVGATEFNQQRQAFLEDNPRFWESKQANLGPDADAVSGLEAPDKYTFIIRLKKPFAPFLKVLAMSYFFVVAPEAVQAYGAATNPPGRDSLFKHPVGTGPFILERWEPDVEIVLTRNPNYWGRDEKGARLPHVDAVRLISRRDPHTAFMEFEEGNSDIAGVPDEDWDRVMNKDKTLKQPYAGKYELKTMPSLTTFYFGFDMQSPPFKGNKALRQALNYAIDRQAIIDTIYRGLGKAAYGPIPPGLPGHDAANKRYEYNPAKARQLLAEAGYPGGKGLDELKLFVSSDGGPPDRTSVAVMEQLRQIGVRISLKQQSWPGHLESIDKHEARFFRLGWIADYPDAENFLALFLTRNWKPGPNSSSYSNPEFDRLYEKAMLEPDEAKRALIYKQAAAIIIEDCPWLYTTTGEGLSLQQPWVRNYPRNPLGLGFYKNVIIDRALTAPVAAIAQ